VKMNFTDVQLSAMENFIRRSDRRVLKVIRKAWENEASIDDWWMDLQGAFDALKTTIKGSGLSWQY